MGVDPCPEVTGMELDIGNELLVIGLLLAAIIVVMWLLASTRRSPR
ncbi:MAG: hypothetical protein ACRDGD_05825 [Candidatus Limnocylindria bacterium]